MGRLHWVLSSVPNKKGDLSQPRHFLEMEHQPWTTDPHKAKVFKTREQLHRVRTRVTRGTGRSPSAYWTLEVLRVPAVMKDGVLRFVGKWVEPEDSAG